MEYKANLPKVYCEQNLIYINTDYNKIYSTIIIILFIVNYIKTYFIV